MQIKTLALVTTSLVAFGLASTTANAKMMGTVHLGTGHTWQDDSNSGPDLDDEFMNIFGGAQVNIPYSDDVNVQIDVLGDAAYADEDDDNNFGTSFTAGAHVNYRDDGGFLGVFGATGRTSQIDEDTTSFFAAGIEGAFFFGKSWIVGGQLGWLDTCCETSGTASNDALHDAGFVRAHGTWFANPGLAVGASVAYIDGERESGPTTPRDVQLWEWTASVEKMVGANTSVFVEYRGHDAEESGADTDESDSHSVSAGFRFHFNATDLFTSATEGPSAQTLRYGRWVSEGGEQLD